MSPQAFLQAGRQEETSKIESRILTWRDAILEVEEPRLQTSSGLTSLASSLTFPKTQLFDCRKSRECAPNDDGKGKEDHRPGRGEGIISGKLSVSCKLDYYILMGSNLIF